MVWLRLFLESYVEEARRLINDNGGLDACLYHATALLWVLIILFAGLE